MGVISNGTTMLDAGALDSGVATGAMTLITTTNISSGSSTVTFNSSINSTYKEYQFHLTDIHGSNDNVYLQVNFRDGSTAYDATKTSTLFRMYHFEDNSTGAVAYETGHDLAESTGVLKIAQGCGSDNDQSTTGILNLFEPSSTTFVKHFNSKTSTIHGSNNAAYSWFVAGYCNVTAAIDGVQFSMSAGTLDAGTIKMYGIK